MAYFPTHQVQKYCMTCTERGTDIRQKIPCAFNKSAFVQFGKEEKKNPTYDESRLQKRERPRMWIWYSTILRVSIRVSLIYHRSFIALNSSVPVRRRQSSSNKRKHPCWLPVFPTFDKCCSAPPPSYFSILLSSATFWHNTEARRAERSLQPLVLLRHTSTFKARCSDEEKYTLLPKMASRPH